MKQEDIRWKQRFANYEKALHQLQEAVLLSEERPLSKLEKQGLIQAFEYTQELAWKLMKDFLNWQGIVDINGSRDAIREAFNKGLISNGEVWMSTITSRNISSHAYDETFSEELVHDIPFKYLHIFEAFHARMKALL